ncbi:(rs)-norcoclaurine 6-o-methyltransferase [Phtheirospermum japonicum]|uniref:(Rs)-norcoclaurine 6-o-methyltransferase n=1 Tax=Phtheirospermum japonicum TaxID=374723 RepID=A0A830BFQ3_9LAMI|nr:(rs)-norcoclaurine 6-o-methyltransferase [Phtheirospermum japonicum]
MESKPMDEEVRAKSDIWGYVFGFTPMAVVKCAIELQIADVLESHGGAMTNEALSAALGCSPTILHRIMRYMMQRGFFKQIQQTGQDSSTTCYIQTALSRMLIKNAAHGEDLWKYASENPVHSKLINDAMACHARLAVSAIVDLYPEAFKGIGSLVDVGGGDGTALRTLLKACPSIRGINFDLPHVVSVAPGCDGVEHVGGDMFEMVPKADACFLMWVLHDWNDDECIRILRKCREAIPKDTGKVIIAEAVINQQGEEEDNKYTDVRLALDMVMLAHTETGKERTIQEWEYVVTEAGFTSCTVKHIQAIVSVIEAYP